MVGDAGALLNLIERVFVSLSCCNTAVLIFSDL